MHLLQGSVCMVKGGKSYETLSDLLVHLPSVFPLQTNHCVVPAAFIATTQHKVCVCVCGLRATTKLLLFPTNSYLLFPRQSRALPEQESLYSDKGNSVVGSATAVFLPVPQQNHV